MYILETGNRTVIELIQKVDLHREYPEVWISEVNEIIDSFCEEHGYEIKGIKV